MCAISGAINLYMDEHISSVMLNTMLRRGPDDAAVYKNEDYALLHARLAVIDLENGRQPMQFAAEDQTYCIVYNGELYNTSEIRKELERMGHSFQTHSDTEVVLRAYAQYPIRPPQEIV